MAAAPAAGPVFFLDEFAMRQWDDPSYSGTQLACDRAQFAASVEDLHAQGKAPLRDGYAPFCKHVFIPNTVGARLSTLRITPANEGLMRSAYSARTPKELPVLIRWFPAAAVGEPPVAKWLDVILYSRDQLTLERAAVAQREGGAAPATLPAAPWGIISIKAQDVDHELPMTPITVLRNALGREEGGSGVPLDREKYLASVAFWREHATIASDPGGE